MTAAFNLSQHAAYIDGSGKLDLTTGIVNALPIANGGTAATTASAARTNLGLGTVSTLNTNASTSQYLRGDGTWSAVTPDTTFGVVGSVAILANFSNTKCWAGTSVSGANLGYASGGASLGGGGWNGSYRSGNVTVPGPAIDNYNVSTTAVSGTWKCLSFLGPRSYDGCGNTTYASAGLFIRVS